MLHSRPRVAAWEAEKPVHVRVQLEDVANALRKKQMHNQETDDEEAQLPELQVLLYSSRRFGPKSIRELTVPSPDTPSAGGALPCMRLRCQSSGSCFMAARPWASRPSNTAISSRAGSCRVETIARHRAGSGRRHIIDRTDRERDSPFTLCLRRSVWHAV